MSDDLSHDTHLRTALRHAPDHALAPPAGVSQTILNAARQVHKPDRPAATPAPAVRITVAPPRALAWLRQWFASPRLAGGLATGLVAALGLGLWLDLGREPVIERAPAPAAIESRRADAAPAAPPATEPSTAPDDTRTEPPAPAAPGDSPRAKRPARSAEAKVEGSAKAPASARQAPAAATPAPERRESSGGQEAEDALAKSAPPTAAAPAAPVPAPAPAPVPAPAMAEASPAAQKPAAQSVGEAQRDAALRSDSRMSLAAGRAAAMAGARASAIDGAAAAEIVTTASPALALQRRARSELAGGTARWTWMPPGKAAIVPLDADADAWLSRVVQASRARWSDSTERSAPGDALEVRWWRDDWPQATLRIEADGLRWIEPGGRVRHAPLDAAALQRLRSP